MANVDFAWLNIDTDFKALDQQTHCDRPTSWPLLLLRAGRTYILVSAAMYGRWMTNGVEGKRS